MVTYRLTATTKHVKAQTNSVIIYFGDGSSARNSSARKPEFQVNLQISLAVFETPF